MGSIFQVDEHDIPWAEYLDRDAPAGPAAIRYKALTGRSGDVPPMQYVEYPPGHLDPVHRHSTGEVLIITSGQFRLGPTTSGPGSAVYIPADTDYALESGEDGVRFFRIVVP